MEELSKEVVAYLEAQSQITAIVGDKIYAVIAPEDVEFPFVVFTINDRSFLTKEQDEFDVTVFLWFDENQYSQAMQFTDTVTEVTKNKNNWDWQNSTFQFIEDNISYCGIINFKKS